MTNNCKKQVLKICEKEKFHVGSVDIQSKVSGDFQENALKEDFKNCNGS